MWYVHAGLCFIYIYIAHDCRYISDIHVLFWGARFMENGSGAKPSIYIYIYVVSLCTQQSSPGFYYAGWCCFWGVCALGR